MIASVAIIVFLMGGGAALRWRQYAREQWVRGVALPQARALLDEGAFRHFEAFRLLRTAESLTPMDPQLVELLEEAAVTIPVTSAPAGSDVWMRDFRDGGEQWEYLGRTPLAARVPAHTPFVWKVAREGFLTQIVIGYSQPPQADFTLLPLAGAPEGMVWIPAGSQEFYNADVMLDPFWIDRVEVTNRAFLDFVRAGGYARTELWRGAPDGVPATLLDKSGRPGPSTWDFGIPPEGRENHPVTGVSWYEASAYCRSVGKDLPTLFHWYSAADPGTTTQWVPLCNFHSSGTMPGGDPLHLNTYGTYDMAGNAREWTRSAATGDFRYALGGSYAEPGYTFSDFWVHRAADRDPHLGFRCAKYTSALSEDQTRPIATPFRDYRLERPASDEQYRIIEQLYDYDRAQPLEGRIEETDDELSSQFRLQLVSFAAAYGGERIRAFLLLPKNTGPPYQVVVWFPGAGPFWSRVPFSVAGEPVWFQFLVRGGRAVVLPEYKGSFERWLGPPIASRNWPEIAVYAAKDIRRAIDYLETRPDLDAARIAYYGMSMGAGIGGLMTAIEPRFKASILLGGGLYPWTRPAHADVFNFLPRVHVPTLMINGKLDYYFPVETSQTPMFNWIGTTRKRHLKYESGHIPSERDDFSRQIAAWLDEHLGVVTLR